MQSGSIFRLFIVVVLWLLCPWTGHSQRVIVNGNGERLIMYPDGSWRLAEASDSILLRQNLQKSETLGYPDDNIESSTKRNPAEEEEYILKQWNELYFNMKNHEKKAMNQFRIATNAQFKASELLQNAEANKSMIESDKLATLHENYEHSIEALRTAKLRQRAIQKLMDESQKLSGQTPDRIIKKFRRMDAQFEDYLSNYDPNHNLQDLSKPPAIKNETYSISLSDKPNNPEGNAEPSQRSTQQHSSSKSKKESDDQKKTDRKRATKISSLSNMTDRLPPAEVQELYRAAPYICQPVLDSLDAITKTHRVVLAPGLIFTDTDPDLRPYFKNKELITCYGRLSKTGAYVYFTIDFQIASSHSQGNFGSLEAGSLLRLRLLNGKYVSLYDLKSDRGHIDPYTGNTVFTGQYALGKDEMKMLTSSPLDRIRILWGTGYEDYAVYKIDFFMDQLPCLLSKS